MHFTEHCVCGKGETFGESKNRWIAAALVLPGVLFIVFFMLVPLFSLCLTSFFSGRALSLSSYFSLFGDVYFQQVFIRSLRLSLLSTALCALLGFPDGVLHRQTFPAQGHDDGAGRLPDVHQPGHPLL